MPCPACRTHTDTQRIRNIDSPAKNIILKRKKRKEQLFISLMNPSTDSLSLGLFFLLQMNFQSFNVGCKRQSGRCVYKYICYIYSATSIYNPPRNIQAGTNTRNIRMSPSTSCIGWMTSRPFLSPQPIGRKCCTGRFQGIQEKQLSEGRLSKKDRKSWNISIGHRWIGSC